ncbi:MAG: TPM domain-containing protein [Lachnospiraceae bacterium]|nr:TPM domain-containing protein [Lachnospiraceae bacterium]
MKKRFLSILLAVLIVALTALPVFAVEPLKVPRLTDDADLLTGEEETKLLAKLDEISERQAFDVVVVTKNGLDGKTPQEYADDYFDYNGFGQGTDYDGALLLLDMDSRSYHISTSGYGITALTDYGMTLMEDSFVPKLSAGNYYDAFTDFANQCDYYVTKAKEGTPIDVPDAEPLTDPEPPVKHKPGLGTAGIAGAIGLLVGSLRANGMKAKLKTVKRQQNAAEYVRRDSMRMRVSRDDFMYRNVTRTARPKETDRDSGSHGGSTTHISSSGHTHGGSGGKF